MISDKIMTKINYLIGLIYKEFAVKWHKKEFFLTNQKKVLIIFLVRHN